MKNYIYLFLFFLSSAVFTQNDSLQNVTGTKCSMAPPKGFIPGVGFSGFQQAESGASIIVAEFPAPYKQLVSGFNGNALKSQGITLVQSRDTEFEGKTATVMLVTQVVNNTNYFKHILLFGDSSYTVMVNGIYPEASSNLEAEIKKAMFSVKYNPIQTVNGEQTAEFKIDIKKSDLKFASFMQGSLIYTSDGKMPPETENKSMIIVGSSFQNVSVENRKEYCLKRVKSLPYGEKNVVEEITPITINNIEGFELTAYGFDKENNKQLTYQVILFTETGSYYIILASAESDFEKYLLGFKEVARSFERK